MKQVIETMRYNGLSYEIYPDGDCVIAMENGVHIQISADFLAQLALKSAQRTHKVIAPVIATTPAAKIGTTPEPKTKSVKSESDIKRKIKLLDEPESGWECTMVIPDQDDIRHVYVSRTSARGALPQTQVGNAGRLA